MIANPQPRSRILSESAIRNPQFMEGPSRPSNRISFPVAAALTLSHLALLIALGLSLHWNVVAADTKSADLTHAMKSGFTAGRIYQAMVDISGADTDPALEETTSDSDHL